MLNFYDYIANEKFLKQFKVNDLLFTIYDCLVEETRFGMWTHHNYFAYVISGKKIWKTSEREYLVGQGDAIFVKKSGHIAHQIFEDKFCVLLVFVPDDFIRQVSHNSQLKAENTGPDGNIDSVIPLQMDEVLAGCFQSMLTYFTQSGPPPKSLLEIKFKELLINILSGTHNPPLNGYFRKLCSHTKISIREIMQANFMYNMSLEEFARLCGRSLSTFKRDFIKTYGTSPGKWLTENRLKYSKYLLENTEEDIGGIAFESGFENKSHFIRIFKEKYGIPPLHYRKTTAYRFPAKL